MSKARRRATNEEGLDEEVTSPLADKAFHLSRLDLTQFRNYERLRLELSRAPLVIVGENGAGKTNLLEAVSLLAPGKGLRRADLGEFARAGSAGTWAVSARVHGPAGAVDVGTGAGQDAASSRRRVRVDGQSRDTTGALGDHVETVWVTPAMDGLFTGPTAERRRFLDRLTLTFDPNLRALSSRFERAMMTRNRLLADGVRENAQLGGPEVVMAEAGVAIAAARVELVSSLGAVIAARRERDPRSPFPWAAVAVAGRLEDEVARASAIDVEESYIALLRAERERDRAAGRTLDGPHRSDLRVAHGPKGASAERCSTGEQKALLVGLVLAHAELVAQRRDGFSPILLFDEAAAHLDAARRNSLFQEIVATGAQAWMTGTDQAFFSALAGDAQLIRVANGTAVIDRWS